MKSSKRRIILLSLIFLLKCLSKSVFIKNYYQVLLLLLLSLFLAWIAIIAIQAKNYC